MNEPKSTIKFCNTYYKAIERYQNGEIHRLDGPAVEYVNGDKEWHINGFSITEQEYATRNQK